MTYEKEMLILKKKEIALLEEIRDYEKATYEMRTDEIITRAEKKNEFKD